MQLELKEKLIDQLKQAEKDDSYGWKNHIVEQILYLNEDNEEAFGEK